MEVSDSNFGQHKSAEIAFQLMQITKKNVRKLGGWGSKAETRTMKHPKQFSKSQPKHYLVVFIVLGGT